MERFPGGENEQEHPPQRRNGWKSRAAAAAFVAAGGLGAAHWAKGHWYDETMARPPVSTRDPLRARGLERRGTEAETQPNLEQLLHRNALTHNELKRVGELLTEESIVSGRIRNAYGRPQTTAREAFEEEFNRRRDQEDRFSAEITDVEIGREHALTRAADQAKAEGRELDYVRLMELCHPWNGIEAALSVGDHRLRPRTKATARTRTTRSRPWKGKGTRSTPSDNGSTQGMSETTSGAPMQEGCAAFLQGAPRRGPLSLAAGRLGSHTFHQYAHPPPLGFDGLVCRAG